MHTLASSFLFSGNEQERLDFLMKNVDYNIKLPIIKIDQLLQLIIFYYLRDIILPVPFVALLL